jgi:hypothetical protein
MENWRDIPGYEGRYQVSDLGNVRSVDRRVDCGYGGHRWYKGKTLALSPHPAGYLQCALYERGKQHSFTVHTLVAMAFLGPAPTKHDVLHLDHNKRNNTPSNLKYGTRGENIAMDFAAGTRKVHPGFIGARWRA